MKDQPTRTEKDSLGAVGIPADALWGAQTQRAVDNFHIDRPLPNTFIRAIAAIKCHAARANAELGLLDERKAAAIITAASAIMDGARSAEHTSELQSRENLVCRLLLEKKKSKITPPKQITRSRQAKP